MLKIDKAVEMIKNDIRMNAICVNAIGSELFTDEDIINAVCPSDFGMCDYDEEKCDGDVMCNHCWHEEVEDDVIPIIEKESNACNKFEMITEEMNELYKIKNANYGNSFSEQFKEYGMTSVCIRLDDKLRRLKSLNSKGSNGTNDESLRDTLIDLANYSVMSIMELDNKGE